MGPLQYFDPKSSANAAYFGPGAFTTTGLACGSGAVAAGAGTYGTTSRNFLRGPGQLNMNIAMAKSTPLVGERLQLTLRAEFFNVFNNVQFSDPSTNINDKVNFGTISSTAPPRIGQLAVRLSF